MTTNRALHLLRVCLSPILLYAVPCVAAPVTPARGAWLDPSRNVEPRARSVARGFRGHDFDALLRYAASHDAPASGPRDRRVWAVEMSEDAVVEYNPERQMLSGSVATHPIRSDVPIENQDLTLHARCRTHEGHGYVGRNFFGTRVQVADYSGTCDVLHLRPEGGLEPWLECGVRYEPSAAARVRSRARVFAIVEFVPGRDRPGTFLTEVRQPPTLRFPVDATVIDRHLTVKLLGLWLVDPGTGMVLAQSTEPAD